MKHKKKILIAEDNDDVRKIMKILFEKHGYEVVEAGESEVVIPAVLNHRPNILILDVMLPGEKEDGFSICAKLKEKYSWLRMPILIVSAIATGTKYTEAEMRIKTGADDFIKKPFDNDNLLKRVEKLLYISR
jgi:DNA-binding response OmpR family regulator